MSNYFSFNNTNANANAGANNEGPFNNNANNGNNENQAEVVGNNVNNWNNDAFDNDDFDSDQLDEDDSYSWVSGTDNQDVNFGVNVNCSTGRGSINIHWRDWNASNANSSDPYRSSQLVAYQGLLNKQLSNDKSNTGARQLESLVDLCSKYVAANVPFELVECFEQPVPEDLQLKIIRSSFPDKIENIRLYSCLANGNADQYERGELLYHNKCVKKVMQIGFHLSAQVIISSQLEANGTRAAASNHASHQGSSSNSNQESQLSCLLTMGGCRQTTFIGNGSGASSLFASVSIVCDRKQVTSCHCTCSKQAIPWCSHIVAVCLYRIFNIDSVEFRPPVSESFSKLKRDQLQKFAQYLISELPQQILPTAQKLLDELLKGNNSSINMMRGAPDPTAGASQSDVAVWCLDELVLKENVHKTLLKFIVLTPNVVSDVESLESSSSVTAADEYKNLLQPLKDRQPDGIWNLVSIVREMLTRRDKNSIPLLKLITCECIEIDQILQYWFLVKAFQLNSDKSIMNTVTVFSQKSTSSSHANMAQTSPVHQRCASLMDEIVTLWRIACLDPYIEEENSKLFLSMLQKWQNQTIERLRRFCNSIINSSTNNWANMNQQSQSATNLNNGQKLLKRLEMDMFAGFMPAINACSINWLDFDLASNITFRQDCLRQISLINNQTIEPVEKQLGARPQAFSESSSSNSSSQSLSSASSSSSSSQPAVNNEATKPDESNACSNTGDSKAMDGIAKLYQYEPAKLKELELKQHQLRIKAGHETKPKADKNSQPQEDTALDILFHRCEALFFHGYIQQACILAECLAEQLLTTRSNPNSLFNTRDSKLSQAATDESAPTNNISHSNRQGRQKCLTSFHNTVLWRAYFLCNILNVCANKMVSGSAQNTFDSLKLKVSQVKWLAFRIGVFGLETARMPAISKTLEVKLLYQEECLMKLLEQIVIGNEELGLLKERATQLKENGLDFNRQQRLINPTGYQSLPILLALFIFESFTSFSMNNNGEFEVEMAQSNFNIGFYQNLGFEAACTVLGMKANASESAHSILCEGIRRQKGVLALKLLEKFKDEEQSLLKIMDRLLDTDVYSLFKQDSVVMLNPFNPNFKKIQQHQLNLFLNENDPTKSASDELDPKTSTKIEPSLPKTPVGVENIKKMPVVNKVSQLPTTTTTTSLDMKLDQETAVRASVTSAKPSNLTYIDSLSSGWEESENESPNLSKDISLLETKYRCMNMSYPPAEPSRTVPALPERAKGPENEPSSDNNSPVTSRKAIEIKTPTGESSQKTSKQRVLIASKVDSGDESDDSSSSGTQSIPVTLKETTAGASAASCEAAVTNDAIIINDGKMESLKRLNETMEKKQQNNSKGTLRAQNQPRQLNQPSLALAHFMFEFSKTVLSKAGGTISNSVYLNHMNHQPVVVHRNLQICSFLIGLYSLGLSNCVQSNWFSRTYSSTVTWLNGQAAEIGYAAICILIECWEGRLTPSECAILADRVSRGRDNMTVRAAAELALSGLKYANYMKPTEIQRAVLQCKEQSKEMLERACIVVEKSVKNDNIFEVLFAVAKRWEELFMEDLNQFNMANNSAPMNPTVPIQTNPDPAPILEMVNGQNQINNANLEAYIREQQQQQQQQQQQGSNNTNNNFFNPGTNNFNRMNFNPNQMFQQQQQQANLPYMNNPAMFQNQMNNNFAPQQQFHSQQRFQQPQAGQASNNPTNATNFPFNLSMQQLNFYQNNMRMQQQHQQQNLNQMMSQTTSMPAFSPTKATEPSIAPVDNNIPPIKHLKTAFRVAMLGLEALPKRADGTNQSVKYRQNPIYFEDVKWLWETAIKLDAYIKGTASLHQFCQTAACVIQNPFVLQKLAFDTANYMSGNNLTQFKAVLASPLLNILVQRCMNLYLRCCQLKLHHMSPNEHDDFISMILTARNIFFYSNNMNCFSDLIQNITRSHRCKRDLQNKIYNALNSPNYQFN